ncbi:MAG: alkaline phosphatase [Fibromonadaceae bacterium]|jgi:alkaline phosphatase|nr:alkaline phosphatase [Fibromonadaceae bacterium]
MKSLGKTTKKVFALVLATIVLFSASCSKQSMAQNVVINANVNTGVQAPKYVFLFIGDGMGFSHIAAAEAYLAAVDGVIGNTSLSFTQFPVMGMATTYSANSYITCSSAAGTALSTGVKTNNDMLGVNPNKEKLNSITYDIKKAGYKIGIATSVSIDHATPGAFFASDTSRNSYYAVASQLALSGFDFFAGSGFWEPTGKSGTEENICNIIRQADYAVVRTPEELKQVPAAQKMVMVQTQDEIECDQKSLVKAVDRTNNDNDYDNDNGWALSAFVKAGIDRLNNPQGFFFMVEGGQIDWAAHDNDAVAVVYEVIDFSKAVKIALEFYNKHPDETLIVLTADHETGGLALGHYDTFYKLSPEALDKQKGKTPKDTTGKKEILKKLSGETGFGWTTYAHTGGAVPVFAIGTGSELFRGKIDNTDIPKKIKSLMVKDL